MKSEINNRFFYFFILIIILFILTNLINKFIILINSERIIKENPFSVNSGIQGILPDVAIELKEIINDAKVEDFKLSDEIIRSDQYQRIIEFLYPIRLNEKSKFLVTLKEEAIKCKLYRNGEKIKLEICKINEK